MPQMIGSAIQGSSANDWQSYSPQAQSPSGPQATSYAQGNWPSILGSAASVFGGGGGRGGYSDPAGAAAYAIQQAPSNTLGTLSKGVSEASLAYGGLNKLTGGATANSTLGGALGAAGGGLQFLTGMQQGGVLGYGSAVAGGLRAAGGVESLLGNAGAAGTLGMAAGYVAAPLALYSAIKNWQSGKTGMDALQGAEAGAAIGSIVPGIGNLVGGLIGGVVGAVSSAFGGGTTSQEGLMSRNFDSQLAGANANQRAGAISGLSPSQSFQMVQGYMNAHDNSPGHSEQIEQVFGKNGVSTMFGQMMPAINQAIAKNPSLASLSPSQMYSQVVAPWLKSKGATISASTKDVKGNPEGQNLIDAITNVVGDWQKGAITSTSSLGVGGESMNIPAYG